MVARVLMRPSSCKGGIVRLVSVSFVMLSIKIIVSSAIPIAQFALGIASMDVMLKMLIKGVRLCLRS